MNNPYVSIEYYKLKSYFELNNKESTIDLCKKNAIINLIELANQWLPEVATHTLIGALQFCRTWSVYL